MKKAILCLNLILITSLLIACSSAPTATPSTFTETATIAPTPDAPSSTPQSDPYANLSFDEYLEISYRDLKLRFPEEYIQLGLDSIYDVAASGLDNPSDEYAAETTELFQVVLDGLAAYDNEALSPAQHQSLNLYRYWLEDYIAGAAFRSHDYTDSGFDILSSSANTEFFFSDIQPLDNIEDAEDYLARLDEVAAKFEQIQASLMSNQAAGIIPPAILFPRLIARIESTAKTRAISTVYFISLRTGLKQLTEIDDATRESLLDRAETIISEDILPAYGSYLTFLQELAAQAPDSVGVGQYPNGDAYYQYLLASYTTTEMTPEEIHQLGLDQLDRIHSEMDAHFNALDYPLEESLEYLYSRVAAESGYLVGSDILPGYETLIRTAETRLVEAFNVLPQQEVVVIADQTGGFYLPGSVDGSRPGAFYAGTTGQIQQYSMPTLTYHETVPGHHLQIALAQELDLPTFRRVEINTAFVEGWALYAERLVKELGWYEEDPLSDLGRLQYEAFRAARLVVDTGIHAMGWDFNQAVDFFVENTGFSTSFAQGQIYRYIAYPGQATAYMVGLLAILDLREAVQAQDGENFDLKAFHQSLLSSGSMPLFFLADQVLNKGMDG
ncbi:DUF885 domain-containing protein [bacterium]|nr:DUF885 domain-containing protein [bacterium]